MIENKTDLLLVQVKHMAMPLLLWWEGLSKMTEELQDDYTFPNFSEPFSYSLTFSFALFLLTEALM